MSSNGSSHSENNSKISCDPYESLKWQVGVVNEAGKFLTAEPFGFKLNVSATSMKQRQKWMLIPDPQLSDVVALRSHLGRFLSSDKDGNVFCEAEELGAEERLCVEYCPKGRWAFKSHAHNLYLSGSEDRLSCFSKSPVWWSVRLAVHPQVHLRNLKRLRYVRLQEDEIHGDQTLPWGYDSLITLEHFGGSKLAVCTRDKRYLNRDGTLTEGPPGDDALYNWEVRCGPNPGLAFRDLDGKYLTLIGATATMKSKNKSVGKDELFVLEDSNAQVGICAFNGKFASIRQGVDVYANQSEMEEKETFQLEHDLPTHKWRIRTCEGKLWTISKTSSGIKGSGNEQDKDALFEMEHSPEGTVTLKAANGMFVSSRKLGLVSASGETASDEERFRLVLVNRPIVVFRSDFGFVGSRTNRIECNMATYEAFVLENAPSGHYYLKLSNGDYWEQAPNGGVLISRGGQPSLFILQFHPRNRVSILGPNGKFLRGEQNGQIRGDADEISSACLWEY